MLFENPEFIHPNAVRAHEKRKAAGVYDQKKTKQAEAKAHKAANKLGESELSNKVVFAADAAGVDGLGSESDISADCIDFGDGDAPDAVGDGSADGSDDGSGDDSDDE